MSSKGEIGRMLRRQFETRRPRLSATVASVPTDSTGKPLNHVIVRVAGQSGILAGVLPGTTLYPGDPVTIEGWGGAATTRYTVVGFQAGTRPDSGDIEIVEDTTIGNEQYGAGDLVWGNPFAAHFHLDYDAGVIYGKTGVTVGLVLDAAGRVIVGNPAGVHQEQTPTGIEWRDGDTVLAALDAAGRTIYGFERLGQPHGPGIEWGEVVDEVTGETRFALRVLGANGEPGIAFLTGTASDPNDYQAIIGPDGGERLIYADGSLDLTGKIHARDGGDIAGWEITADQLRSASSAVVLDSDGIVVVNDQAGLHGTDATWRIWAGASLASRASAPFRVDKSGNVYATSVKTLTGTASPGSGNYVLDITGEGSGANGIQGVGVDTGVRGQANKYGCYGYATGTTGACGVYGTGGSSYTGVYGKGDPGVIAEAYGAGDDALRLINGPLNANSQNIENVNRIYFDSTHYLYMSGNDLYWYNGSTGIKLN